jgi:23S rRNA pseudouridine2605 synthase
MEREPRKRRRSDSGKNDRNSDSRGPKRTTGQSGFKKQDSGAGSKDDKPAEGKQRYDKRPDSRKVERFGESKKRTSDKRRARADEGADSRPGRERKFESGDPKKKSFDKRRFSNDESVDSTKKTFSKYPEKKRLFPKKSTKNKSGDTIRLNKYIANAGICSRREADEFIKTGVVSVNGKVVTEMGFQVNPGDDVKFNNDRIKAEKKVYLLLNKPKDFVTTLDDPYAKKTVMDLVKNACPERIYPVGRLDRNTTGVLLFTNDGDLAKKLTHPKFRKKKIYHVFLDKAVTRNDLQKIENGMDLEDGFIQPDAIEFVDEGDKSQIGIELHSGRNRIVRRIFEHLGYKVMKLDRVYFAGLTKKNVPRGKFRFLTEKELNLLKMNAFS